jgi:hypothetical protein
MSTQPQPLTKQEALDTYGSVPLYFAHYYKYCFTFSGTAQDGSLICASIGGHYEDIYRLDVNAHDVLYLTDQDYISVSILKDGIEIYRYYE